MRTWSGTTGFSRTRPTAGFCSTRSRLSFAPTASGHTRRAPSRHTKAHLASKDGSGFDPRPISWDMPFVTLPSVLKDIAHDLDSERAHTPASLGKALRRTITMDDV